MVDMLIIIQNIYEINLLHNMPTIEVNANGEFGLLPKLENNVKEVIWVELHFVLCLHRSIMIQIVDHYSGLHYILCRPLYSGFRVKFAQVT